jgi:hypothetical protein
MAAQTPHVVVDHRSLDAVPQRSVDAVNPRQGHASLRTR